MALAAVQRTFESHGRYWMESFRLPGMSREEVDAGLTYEGFEHIEKARADGHGPSWPSRTSAAGSGGVLADDGGRHPGHGGGRAHRAPGAVREWFVEFRRSLGMNRRRPEGMGSEVVRGGPPRRLVLLSDRDIQGGGIEVEFFGERTTLPGGPPRLACCARARRSCRAVYNRAGHHCVIREPVPVEARGSLPRGRDPITQFRGH